MIRSVNLLMQIIIEKDCILISANAVTNGQGSILSYSDLRPVQGIGDNALPEKITWQEGVIYKIGDIMNNDKWSLLARYILDIHKIDVRTPVECFLSTKSAIRKIELNEKVYLLKKSKIHTSNK